MEAGAADDATEAGSEGPDVPTGAAATPEVGNPDSVPVQRGFTPLFRAQHEDRYLRQNMIREYQADYSCNLVVMIDQITPDSVTLFTELLYDLDISKDLHLLLCSPGGDGETAIRLARMAQASCRQLVVVVPEVAKSAATILALGAHEIVMGPTSDLGPIDPQILVPDRGFFSAKDLIAAVESALNDVAARPDTYPLHAAMLAGIDTTIVQFARSALARTGDLARQAIGSHPERDAEAVTKLCQRINDPLIESPRSHGAVIGGVEAKEAGLPITSLGPQDQQWRSIWSLWTRYFALGPLHNLVAYEGERASQVYVAGSG